MKQVGIKSTEFIGSFPGVQKCPKPDRPEYAFIGRSNVGKSSLINMLTGRKNLARISNKPGKTRLINHFLINSQWYLVDLPGYGFAKISKKERESWGKMIHKYIIQRTNLLCTFLLIDSRLEPQRSDLDFIDWMGAVGLPFVIVFTKSDKLGKNQLSANLEAFKNKLLEKWAELPQLIVTSAKTSLGREALVEFITETNKIFK